MELMNLILFSMHLFHYHVLLKTRINQKFIQTKVIFSLIRMLLNNTLSCEEII